jgi:hypothetical protein
LAALDLPVVTRVRPFESSANGLKAAGFSVPADRQVSGSEAIAQPRGLGLISDPIPLFQHTLQRAFDRFLTRMKDIGASSSSGPESSVRWVAWLALMVTGIAGAGAFGRWRFWGLNEDEERSQPSAGGKLGRHGLPGLPSVR